MNITDHVADHDRFARDLGRLLRSPADDGARVTQDAFSRGKWQAAIDRWFAISKDEDGDTPTVQQFPADDDAAPHGGCTACTRRSSRVRLAFPVANLGIVTDNTRRLLRRCSGRPSSSEHCEAAEPDHGVLASSCGAEECATA